MEDLNVENNSNEFQELLDVDISRIDNSVVSRLIEEVRNENEPERPSFYNRFHNRHNR